MSADNKYSFLRLPIDQPRYRGKWPADQVAIMESAFEQIMQSVGTTGPIVRDAWKDRPMVAVYKMAAIAQYDLSYDDNHPAYHGHNPRTRQCDYNSNYVLYPKGCNDTHRETMLKHIAKKLGIIG